MGLEARCVVEWQARKQTAALHLDSAHLDVRIKPALRIAFSSLRSINVDGEWLLLATPDGRLALQLGAEVAQKWAKKLRNPRSRLQKLGIAAGARVCWLGSPDADFDAELSSAGSEVARRLVKNTELVFLFAPEPAALDKLAAIVKSLAPDGAVWVVREKGKTSKVGEDDVRKRARQAGLVDVKVLAFSETLSALKLVIPVAKR